jgi:hypothetical protein
MIALIIISIVIYLLVFNKPRPKHNGVKPPIDWKEVDRKMKDACSKITIDIKTK